MFIGQVIHCTEFSNSQQYWGGHVRAHVHVTCMRVCMCFTCGWFRGKRKKLDHVCTLLGGLGVFISPLSINMALETECGVQAWSSKF